MEYANFAALFIGLALVPGIPANGVFWYLCGVDRREPVLAYLLRILLFSTLGLVAATLLSIALGYPIASSLIRDARVFVVDNPATVLMLYLGQYLFAVTIAAASGGVIAYYDLILRVTWERFLRYEIPNRWVVVTLTSGERYSGFVKSADVDAGERDRDLILGEPALYDPAVKNYRALPYTSLFLKAQLVTAVAIVYNSKLDAKKRMTRVNSLVFPEKG